jgi:hypothetical protein
MIHNRPRGWQKKKDVVRVQCHLHPDIVGWIDRYCDSRQRARSHVGSQALLFYFFSWSWGDSWLSAEETLCGPDVDSRNNFIVSAYAVKSYLAWFDTLPEKVEDVIQDSSPDNMARLRDMFGSRIYSVRRRSMHLKRALTLYYKACQVQPNIIEIDFDGIRPMGYEWCRHDFDNHEYLFKYTEKIGSLINIDLSQPPPIKLFNKDN